jgi:uncharacterized membrane protein
VVNQSDDTDGCAAQRAWRANAAGKVLTAMSPLGIVFATLLFSYSLAPSLLVRSWVFQGVLGGVCLAVGYGFGVLLQLVGSWTLGWFGLSPTLGDRSRSVLLAAVIALAAYSVLRAAGQHRWTWDRLGYDPSLTVTTYAAAIGLAVVTAAALLALAQLVRLLQGWVARLGAPLLPAAVAGTLALVLVLWALLAASNTWVLQRTLDGMNDTFAAADLEVRSSTPPPPDGAPRSGTSDSAVSWDEIGHEGRRFLTRGPDVADIEEALPADPHLPVAVQPVRVFVGRSSADTVEGRVALAMAELERLDAFSRRAVVVVVPTGTGWVNEQVVAPPEYLLGGSTATVAVQYSHLPSPMAYVAEHESAGETGVRLVDAVRTRLDSLPAGSRPDLLVAGESLGSFGAAQAFQDLDDLLHRTRASLWVGPPEFMHLRREAETTRIAGSPQIRPRVGDGTDVVFANRRSDLEETMPRTVFLQQADDPIVWWDLPTLYRRPDWLAEPLDSAVNPAMTWRPVATFLNLTVDMAVGNDFDEDHGHLYGTQPLAAWAAMLAPRGWGKADVERLRRRLETLDR